MIRSLSNREILQSTSLGAHLVLFPTNVESTIHFLGGSSRSLSNQREILQSTTSLGAHLVLSPTDVRGSSRSLSNQCGWNLTIHYFLGGSSCSLSNGRWGLISFSLQRTLGAHLVLSPTNVGGILQSTTSLGAHLVLSPTNVGGILQSTTSLGAHLVLSPTDVGGSSRSLSNQCGIYNPLPWRLMVLTGTPPSDWF